MKKLGFARMFCCAGVCLVAVACSAKSVRRSSAGSGGTTAVGGSSTGGRADAGAAGRGNGGTVAAGSGGRSGADAGGGGQGGACRDDVTHGLLQRTLAEYCEDHDCPRTIELARENVIHCQSYSYSEETTGCGYTVVRFRGEYLARGFVFEGRTLVGAYWSTDYASPPCNTWGEVGNVYPPDCPGADSCRLCDGDDGSAGEGPLCDFGGAGAGGEGGWGGHGG